MNDKTKIWKRSTTTRSWSSTTNTRNVDAASERIDLNNLDLNDLDKLSPEEIAKIEALLDGALDGETVSHRWSYAGVENGETFNVDIDNGAVTVNGRHYDSLDEVPRADRERIDALRSGQGMEGLWGMLKDAGMDVGGLGVDAARSSGKPAFTIETESGGTDAATATATGAPSTTAGAAASRPAQTDVHASRYQQDPTQSPGAVPTGGGLRRTLLIGIAIGLGWWVARALNLF